MLTDEQARERAEEWINGSRPEAEQRDVYLHPFDGGWVVWSAARDPAYRTFGDALGVLDADTGKVSLWPPMEIEDVVRRYQAEKEQADRFPADVAEALRDGGWFPGRSRREGDLQVWLRQLNEADAVQYERFAAANEAMTEFFGIWVEPEGQPAFSFTQAPEEVDHAAAARLAQHLGRRVLPLGSYHDAAHPATIVIQQSAQVYLVRPDRAIVLGEDLDAALIQLCRGPAAELPTLTF